MIRPLLICSSLVASSAAGAVALSALHDAAGDRSVRTLAPEPVATVEPRFVIPTYAPSRKAPEEVQVALRDAPVLPAAVAEDAVPAVAPVETAVVQQPEVAPVPRTVVAPTTRANVAVPQPRAKARAPRSAQPVIVAQAPSFLAQDGSAIQPDWVIGVYR